MRTNQWLAQLWLDALPTELGMSAGTIDTYPTISTATLPSLTRTASVWTRSARSRSRTTLHRFLIAEDLGSHDPTSTMPSMPRSRKLPFVLSVSKTTNRPCGLSLPLNGAYGIVGD